MAGLDPAVAGARHVDVHVAEAPRRVVGALAGHRHDLQLHVLRARSSARRMFGEPPELLIVISMSPAAREAGERQRKDLFEREIVAGAGQQRRRR